MGNHNNNPNKTGKGKKGWYKGFFCSSTYELAYVIFCLDHLSQSDYIKSIFSSVGLELNELKDMDVNSASFSFVLFVSFFG